LDVDHRASARQLGPSAGQIVTQDGVIVAGLSGVGWRDGDDGQGVDSAKSTGGFREETAMSTMRRGFTQQKTPVSREFSGSG
jgi:hypothetical protein